MGKLIECLLCKCEDHSSTPKIHIEKCQLHTRNLSTGKQRKTTPWSLLILACLVSSRPVRHMAPDRWHPRSSSSIRVLQHTCIYFYHSARAALTFLNKLGTGFWGIRAQEFGSECMLPNFYTNVQQL